MESSNCLTPKEQLTMMGWGRVRLFTHSYIVEVTPLHLFHVIGNGENFTEV